MDKTISVIEFLIVMQTKLSNNLDSIYRKRYFFNQSFIPILLKNSF